MKRVAIAGGLCLGCLIATCVGVRYETQEDTRMRTIPYEMTPNSLVRCYNKFGTIVYENKITDRTVTHVLTRLPCGVYYGGGCCISDPPKDGTEDGRRWGIGRSDSDVVVDLDGRGVECVSVKGFLP